MTEVTKHNLENNMDKIRHDLSKCTYYSLDCEFSLLPTDQFENSLFDNCEDRYKKIKDNMDGCTILQVGICPFVFNRDLNHFSANMYKFYICSGFFGDYDTVSKFKASTIDFLTKNKFDFNKVFHDGMNCLNETQEKKITQDFKSGKLTQNLSSYIILDDWNNILTHLENIKIWLSKSKIGDKMEINVNKDLNHIFLLHQYIRSSFDNVWTHQLKNVIVVESMDKEKRKKMDGNDITSFVIESLKGFSNVFQLMIDCKKPLVGHNLYLDLITMYHQFYKELPGTYKKFKSELHSLFPHVYDTKFMSYEIQRITKKDVLDNNSLGNLFNLYKTKNGYYNGPGVIIDPTLNANAEEQHLHDAGWDAYITGYCFIKLCFAIAIIDQGNPVTFQRFGSKELLNKVNFLKNQLNLPRAQISYLNLDGPEPKSTRPPLLHVGLINYDSTQGYIELKTLLNKHPNVHFKKLSQSSTILAAANYTCYKDILRDLHEKNIFLVEKYSLLKHSKIYIYPIMIATFVLPALGIWLSCKNIGWKS